MKSRKRRATIADVAELAGVSAATVSRVFNKTAPVNGDLESRVRSAAEQLGYMPDSIARSLRTQRTMTWAVLITDIQNSFYTSLVRGIEDIAQANGYSVMLCNTDEDLVKESEYLSVVAAARMAGVVISPSSATESDVTGLLELGTPVVAIDRRIANEEVDTVLVDNIDGARRGTNHLVGIGRTRIACITGSPRTTTGSERLLGYKRALDEAGLPYDEQLVRYADFKESGGFRAASELMDLEEPPDAIFVANNLMTLGTLEALREREVPIPDRVAVVGFDDEPWAEYTRPPLTVVAQPTYEMGRQAAELLLERIGGASGPAREVILRTELRVRESG
jgi:LacI family transcriptional regulator